MREKLWNSNKIVFQGILVYLIVFAVVNYVGYANEIPITIKGLPDHEAIVLSYIEVMIVVLLALFSLFLVPLGIFVEYGLYLDHLRIIEGEKKRSGSFLLNAVFKDYTSFIMAAIGILLTLFGTQVEAMSSRLDLNHVMSGIIILFAPFLYGRMYYTYKIHMQIYREKKTYALNGMIVRCLGILFVYLLGYSIQSALEFHWVFCKLDRDVTSIVEYSWLFNELLLLCIFPYLIDLCNLVLHAFRLMDQNIAHHVRISLELGRLLGLYEIVDQVEREKQVVRDDGVISNDGSLEFQDIATLLGA